MSDQYLLLAAEPASLEAWLAEIRRCEREGGLFRAYDLAMRGLEHFPGDAALKHRAVLCLARSGAIRQAIAQFEKLFGGGRWPATASPQLALDIAALGARLLKDEALAAAGSERPKMLARAAEEYAAVYGAAKAAGNPEAYYPAVNCASLRLLAGDGDGAAAMAHQVLAEFSTRSAEIRGYYEIASEIEARLVLGEIGRAGALLPLARASAGSDLDALATTIRQLRLILAVRGLAAEWLDVLMPPRVVNYLGHIISPPGVPGRFPAEQEAAVAASIAEKLAVSSVGFGFGSLAAGADVLFAEALLARGANLEVVLPFDRDEFVEVSVRPAGASWVGRFHACLERASTLRFATEDRYLGDDSLFAYCSRLAMGLALLRARHLETGVEQIAVWDGDPAAGPAGTAADIALWRRTGLPQTTIAVAGSPAAAPNPQPARAIERRTRAMLFSDAHGFSKLRDEQLPRFIDTILGCCARTLDRFRNNIRFANTWGDGLFVVFDDAGTAARCALALQEALAGIDLVVAGLPADLGLRIGCHLGPVYAARDPILGRENFFGAHVSRAARIEPVTPENCVYVTELMAAALALDHRGEFACEYVGMTEAAKHYGAMRMFLLSRRGG